MIVGDNTAGHGFVLRDLVLIELSGHAPPLQFGGGRLKISERYLLGASEILILLGGYCWGGGSLNFEVKIKAA